MGKLKINIDTGAKIQKFVDIINKNNIDAVLETTTSDGEDYRVNARSVLGALATMEWANGVWVRSKEDIYSLIEEFVVI